MDLNELYKKLQREKQEALLEEQEEKRREEEERRTLLERKKQFFKTYTYKPFADPSGGFRSTDRLNQLTKHWWDDDYQWVDAEFWTDL